MNPEDLSLRYQPDLGTELSLMVGDSTLPLYHMMRYHLGWCDASGQSRFTKSGKMLRSGLCLLSCESVGGDWHLALPAAAALELVHNFSLIHDDIEDEDLERRGMPTVWCVWGQAQAINAGDAMHTLARLALLRLESKGVDQGRVLRSARLLDETCLRLCEGQYLDISYEERFDINVEDYLQMIACKTAALFECSLKLGALLGTDNEQAIEHLSGFGHNLGLAFQIHDDVLGIWGEDSKTGKSSASDIHKKKKTLPVIYAINNAGPGQREKLFQIYSQDMIVEEDISPVIGILDSVGAREYVDGVARGYYKKAMSELEKAPISSSGKEELTSLAQFVIGREY